MLQKYKLYKTRQEAQRKEGNLDILILRFPLIEGARWNGNLYNNLDERTFNFSQSEQNLMVNDLSLDSVIVVEQDSNINLIQRDVAFDKYAKGIGLIYRFREFIFTRTDGINTENDVDSGLTYKMVIRDYHTPS